MVSHKTFILTIATALAVHAIPFGDQPPVNKLPSSTISDLQSQDSVVFISELEARQVNVINGFTGMLNSLISGGVGAINGAIGTMNSLITRMVVLNGNLPADVLSIVISGVQHQITNMITTGLNVASSITTAAQFGPGVNGRSVGNQMFSQVMVNVIDSTQSINNKIKNMSIDPSVDSDLISLSKTLENFSATAKDYDVDTSRFDELRHDLNNIMVSQGIVNGNARKVDNKPAAKPEAKDEYES